MKKPSPLRRKAQRFLRWRKEKYGIDFVDLRKEGRGGTLLRQPRNFGAGVEAGIAEVDVAFRHNARTGRGDWR